LIAAHLGIKIYHLVPRVLLGLMWTGQVMSKPESDAPKVTVVNGTYAGVHSREYEEDFFLGMPYAKVTLLTPFDVSIQNPRLMQRPDARTIHCGLRLGSGLEWHSRCKTVPSSLHWVRE
jgi:hypothetical protein